MAETGKSRALKMEQVKATKPTKAGPANFLRDGNKRSSNSPTNFLKDKKKGGGY